MASVPYEMIDFSHSSADNLRAIAQENTMGSTILIVRPSNGDRISLVCTSITREQRVSEEYICSRFGLNPGEVLHMNNIDPKTVPLIVPFEVLDGHREWVLRAIESYHLVVSTDVHGPVRTQSGPGFVETDQDCVEVSPPPFTLNSGTQIMEARTPEPRISALDEVLNIRGSSEISRFMKGSSFETFQVAVMTGMSFLNFRQF